MSNYPTDDGLIQVAGEDLGAQWEWDITDVWYNPENGGYYVYSGAGCSCNGPYEFYEGINDLEGPMTFAQAISNLGIDGKTEAMQWKEPV